MGGLCEWVNHPNTQSGATGHINSAWSSICG